MMARPPLVATEEADDADDLWAEPEEHAQPSPPPSPAYADAADRHSEDPPTEGVDVLAEREADDDAYLTELRKAMTDDTPLGPRDEEGDDALFDGGTDVGRSRFGRRR